MTILAARTPDAPVSLQNNAAVTAETTIGLAWSDGVYNGASNILDYRISYDQGSGNFVILASQVSSKSYTATGLTNGQTYSFKIEARNLKGYSAFSNQVSILCSRIPDAPTNLAYTAQTSNDVQIALTWANGASNGGSSIIDYRVSYDQGSNVWLVL